MQVPNRNAFQVHKRQDRECSGQSIPHFAYMLRRASSLQGAGDVSSCEQTDPLDRPISCHSRVYFLTSLP